MQVQGVSARIFSLGTPAGRVYDIEKVSQVGGVLLLILENAFDKHAGSGIVVGKMADHFCVNLDDDAFGDQVFADHVGQGFTFNILRGGTLQQITRIEVGLAAQLLNALG